VRLRTQSLVSITIGAFLALANQAPGAAGQTPAKPAVAASLPSGAKLFIATMDWNLDRFIGAEIRRQGLPVQLVARRQDADFVMTGLYAGLGSHLFSPGHYIQVQIVAADGGKSVWSAEANDYATFFARLRSHGPGRAAKSIVTQMRGSLFKARRFSGQIRGSAPPPA